MKQNNGDILEQIISYCQDIEASVKRFGNDQAIFEADRDYRNSVCMSLFQIGELTGHLSEDFREGTKGKIYWPAIKGMRNLLAHNYGAMDNVRIWETVISDIPQLKACCQTILSEISG